MILAVEAVATGVKARWPPTTLPLTATDQLGTLTAGGVKADAGKAKPPDAPAAAGPVRQKPTRARSEAEETMRRRPIEFARAKPAEGPLPEGVRCLPPQAKGLRITDATPSFCVTAE